TQCPVSARSARRCLANPFQTGIGEEVVAQELWRSDFGINATGYEAMRAEATRILRLGNGNGTFPGEHVGEKQVTGSDAEQSFGTHVGAGEWRLVERAFAKRADAQFR